MVHSTYLPNPGIKPRSAALQVDFLPAEPQGKPKNTGVGSLLLLQRILLTQELNQGLLHCRQILYQQNYEGSLGFPCGSVGKESTSNVGDLGLIPALGRSPGEGNGYSLMYSFFFN